MDLYQIYPTYERTSHRCFATDVSDVALVALKLLDSRLSTSRVAADSFPHQVLIVDLNDIPDNVIIVVKGKPTDVSFHCLALVVLLCSYRPALALGQRKLTPGIR